MEFGDVNTILEIRAGFGLRRKSRYLEQDEYDIAWLAGILEGEGCFQLHRNSGGRSPVARLQLKMTDLDVVQRAAQIMCSEDKVKEIPRPDSFKEHYKTQYLCVVYGQTAKDVMRAILPYMGERRSEKIREVLKCAY